MTDSALDPLVEAAFWTLAVLCLLSATGMANMGFGAPLAWSAVTVLACLPALAGLLRIGPREGLGTPGLLLVSCLASYALVGMVVAILSGAEPSAMRYLKDTLFSILIVSAAAVGGRVVWRRIGATRLLLGILLILAASCTLMLSSPWLLDIVPNAPQEGAFRFFGSFANPNQAAVNASFGLVTALALLRRGRFPIFMYGVLLLAAAAVIGTISRMAIIALPILLLGSLFSCRRAERGRLFGAVAIVVVAATAGAAMSISLDMLEEAQLARFRALTDVFSPVPTSDPSFIARLALAELGLDQALESPVLGNGLGSFHQLEGAWYNAQGDLMGVHNQYLLILGEAGFLPLMLFLSFLAVTLHAGFRKERVWTLGAVSGWAAVVSLFSLASHNLLLHWHVNFMLGLGCAVMTGCLSGQRGRGGASPAS